MSDNTDLLKTLTPQEIEDVQQRLIKQQSELDRRTVALEAKEQSLLPAKKWNDCSKKEKKDRLVNFGTHILITTLIPFFPIIYSLLQNGRVEISGFVLTLTIYMLTVALAARELGFFISGLLAAFFFMPLYGQLVTANGAIVPNSEKFVGWLVFSAIILTVSNILNAYVDHIVDEKPVLGILK